MSRIIFVFCLIAFSTTNAQHKSFSLDGKTADIEDGTYLYFRDLVNGGNIDSALVKNNSFKFETDLPEPALYVMIFTKDRSKFTELWLENGPMTFDSSNGNFTEAEVTGSRNHFLEEKINKELYNKVSQAEKDVLKQQEKRFFKENYNAVVSAKILYANPRYNQNEIGEIFSNFSEEVQNSSIGQRIAKDLEKDIPEIGEIYLDFSIPNSEGENKKISDLTGRLTLLQFWSSGCGFSRTMNTILAKIYHKYHLEGLEIISISKDTNKEYWVQAIKDDELPWSQLSNLQGWNEEAFKAYGVHATPSNFLINSSGIIVERNLRGDEIEEKIREHLAK